MEKKYLELLDDEIQEFIRQTEEFYPADAVNFTIDQQRQYYDALCQEYDEGYPEGVTASDRWVSGREGAFKVRDYSVAGANPRAHMLYFHGGGFVVGGLESHDSICAEFAAGTQCSLTSVDYRLCPEYPHPASYDDCLNTFRRTAKETDLPVILVGDSAGGNLAAAVCHAVRKEWPAPAGQLLIYPGLGGNITKGSYVEHAKAPLLTTSDIKYYEKARFGGPSDRSDITARPLSDSDYSGLPPTVIIAAACDPLADDGGIYEEIIQEAGGKAKFFNEAGLIHGYLRARQVSKRAKESFARMIDVLNMFADGRWDYD